MLGGASGVFGPAMGRASGVFGPAMGGASAGDSGETGDATCVPVEGPGSASADRPSSCESMPCMKLTKSSKASRPEGSDSMAAGGGAQGWGKNLELKTGCAKISGLAAAGEG